MPYPSCEPACVMVSVHPAGAASLLGELAKKSSKGTGIHANQNVPMVVEPVSCKVMVYWVSPEASWVAAIVADALSAIVGLLSLFIRPKFGRS